MSDETKIHVMAVLCRQKPADPFKLVIRWILGTGEALPRSDDIFQVQVLLNTFGRQVARDGSIVDPAPEHWIEVRPRNFAMVDPPRVPKELGRTASGEGFYQAVAVKPTGPVDPNAAASGSLRTGGNGSAAVGVIHILDETEPSREAWRIANAAAPAFRRTVNVLADRGRVLNTMAVSRGEDPAERSARALARFFIRANVRPRDMPKLLTAASARFREMALTRMLRSPEDMPSAFKMDDGGMREHADHAALVSAALNDPVLIEALDDERRTRQQTRQQLRLRALQGGKLIDFWCNPDAAEPVCDDGRRGAEYPSALLIGTGLEIPNIPQAVVQQWIADGEIVRVKVRHDNSGHTARVDRPLAGSEAKIPGNVALADVQVDQWEPGEAPPLRPANELQAALGQGSSHLPPPPESAEINYNLTQSDAGANTEQPTVTFETGEGKVQFFIKSPKPGADGSKTVYSFNLYGMWEEPSTAAFFADAQPNPSLDELKVWRISARYSYTRDLKEAFPGAGAPHQAILQALADPPWFPIFEQPAKIYEASPPPNPVPGGPDPTQPSTQPQNQALPKVAAEGMTATAIDLRKGMGSSFGTPAGVTVRWDPFGLLDKDWSPFKRRDGSPAQGRPQRYRFWVTSVDAFEQESAPVPVRANDTDAGEKDPSYIYTPFFRTVVGAPPQRHDSDANGVTRALRIEFNEPSDQLTVFWETPDIARVAGDDSQSVPARERFNKTTLVARVVIFQKRLLDRVSDDSMKFMAFSFADKVNEPQWRAAYAQMKEQGFEPYKEFDAIDPPANGDVWSKQLKLDWADRGFEYIAGVNFRLRGNLTAFWAPDALIETAGGRKVVFQKLKGDEYEPSIRQINEVPRSSDVSLTDTLPVVNDAIPRGASSIKAAFTAARPVPPPVRTQRDLVLLRLLSHAFSDAAPQPWIDTGVELSVGKIAMCETAIRRTLDPGGTDPKIVKLPRLKELRCLLAKEFGGIAASAQPPGDGSAALRGAAVLAHHSTLGFRGIQTLRWGYTPFADSAPADRTEAEAVAVRIHQVRAPIDYEDALRFATFRGKAEREAQGRYRFSAIDARDPKAIEAIAKLNQPAVARLSAAPDQHPQFGYVLELSPDAANPVIRIADIAPSGPALPAKIEIMVFAAQPLSVIPVDDFSNTKEYSLDVPVGGGTPEMFFWWMSAVSAQGREATPARRPTASLLGSQSIEPEPPTEFETTVPTDPIKHELDPTDAQMKKFLPQRIWDDKERAHLNPRLLATWRDPDPSAAAEINARLVIFRQGQNVSAEEDAHSSSMRFMSSVSPWTALKLIEGAAATDQLTVENLAALQPWLMGTPVTPNDQTPVKDEDVLIGVKRNLSSVKGLIELEVPGTGGLPKRSAGFIDYFYANDDARLAMEGSWLYRYKAARVIDLDPEGAFGLPDDARYLWSRPTDWTPFRLPEAPPMVITSAKDNAKEIPAESSPIVTINFNGKPPSHMMFLANKDTEQIREWYYRIVVRRKIEAGLPAGAGTPFEARWIEVGNPVILLFDKAVSFADSGLDREDPGQAITAQYRLTVTQVAVIEDAQGAWLRERVVRNAEDKEDELHEFTVDIPAMKSDTSGGGMTKLLAEWNAVQNVWIY